MIENRMNNQNETQYTLRVILEGLNNAYNIENEDNLIFKQEEFSLIGDANNTLKLIITDLNRFIENERKRKRRKRIFKKNNRFNLEIAFNIVINHETGIMYIPRFNKSEFCLIENVNETLCIFKVGLARFIEEKIIKNKR